MKEKMRRFMTGRYGSDQLGRFIIILSLAAIMLNLFVRSQFLYGIGVFLLIISYFRMFSRNISRRYKENQLYLGYEMRGKEFFYKHTRQLGQIKKFHIYKCPTCGQKIRVPRKKGRISIHCPKCGMDFIKRS